MGVFTDSSVFNEILIVYVLSTLGFTVLYYLSKVIFPSILKSISSTENCFFALSE